jgi:hypothetical protein
VVSDYRHAGGHHFGLLGEPCARCGMTREAFEETGEPDCTDPRGEASTNRRVQSSRRAAQTRSKN